MVVVVCQEFPCSFLRVTTRKKDKSISCEGFHVGTTNLTGNESSDCGQKVYCESSTLFSIHVVPRTQTKEMAIHKSNYL